MNDSAALPSGGGRWHPVLPSSDLPTPDPACPDARAGIALGFVPGAELALWRAPDGTAQAWTNRCPHRGLRFTLGRIVDGRLACGYHGWEFQAGDGRCVAIPAHPQMKVPRICAQAWRTAEAEGMIWVRHGGTDAAAADTAPPPATGTGTVVRTLGICAPAAAVVEHLLAQGWHAATPDVYRGELAGCAATAFLTPASAGLVLLHAGVAGKPDVALSARLHAALRRLRDDIEARHAAPGDPA